MVTADGEQSFAQAVRRKLILEIADLGGLERAVGLQPRPAVGRRSRPGGADVARPGRCCWRLRSRAGAGAPKPVDLELLLLADATSSIDAVEMAIQRRGYASAMIDPEVLRAIRNGGELGRIAVAYVEWASARRQEVVVDWMVIDGAGVGGGLRRRGCLLAPRRVKGVNAIGAALMQGLELIEANGFEGYRKVIDLSGDSAWNPRRPTLGEARAAAVAAGVGINGLAVLCDDCSGRQGAGNLEQQFTDQLISGPGAFVVTADGRDAFAQAVRRKLVLEIAGPAAWPRLAGAAVTD